MTLRKAFPAVLFVFLMASSGFAHGDASVSGRPFDPAVIPPKSDFTSSTEAFSDQDRFRNQDKNHRDLRDRDRDFRTREEHHDRDFRHRHHHDFDRGDQEASESSSRFAGDDRHRDLRADDRDLRDRDNHGDSDIRHRKQHRLDVDRGDRDIYESASRLDQDTLHRGTGRDDIEHEAHRVALKDIMRGNRVRVASLYAPSHHPGFHARMHRRSR
jgi:hypothetical protein